MMQDRNLTFASTDPVLGEYFMMDQRKVLFAQGEDGNGIAHLLGSILPGPSLW
jgi:hypothetical protein